MSQNLDPDRTGARGATPPPLPFEVQFLAILPQLRRYSKSLTRSVPDSEDLLQDCVEKALLNRGQWHGANLRAWACRIMTNLYLNARRSKARRPALALEDVEMMAAPGEGDALTRSRLLAAVDTLAPDARAVLMLVIVEGYAYREVADMLGIPEGTVMSRLSRARRAIRETLKDGNVVPLRRNT